MAFWNIIWRAVTFVILWGFFLAALLVPLGEHLRQWEHEFPLVARLYGDVASAVTLVAATWLMVRFIDRRPFRTIGFSTGHAIKDIVQGLATGTLWLAVSLLVVWILGWASPVSPAGFSWLVLLGAGISMLFNVMAQELLLCGFVFQTIRTRSNAIIAVATCAILFAGLHAGAFRGAWLPPINVCTAGILFCLAYLVTDNLWFPIAIHFSWDVLLGPVLGMTESGNAALGGSWKLFTLHGPSFPAGGEFGLEGGFVVTMSTLGCIALLGAANRAKVRAICAEARLMPAS